MQAEPDKNFHRHIRTAGLKTKEIKQEYYYRKTIKTSDQTQSFFCSQGKTKTFKMQLYRSPSAEPAQAVPAEVPGELCESLRQRIQDFYGPSESTLETKRWLDTFTSDARVVIGSDFSADGIEGMNNLSLVLSQFALCKSGRGRVTNIL